MRRRIQSRSFQWWGADPVAEEVVLSDLRVFTQTYEFCLSSPIALLFCLVTLIHLVGLPVLPKQTCHQTKGGTGDGPDVADAEN